MTARFAPTLTEAGAIKVTRHNSRAVDPPPVKKMHVTSVEEVVVNENAYTFARFVGVKVRFVCVAVNEPVAVVSVLPVLSA